MPEISSAVDLLPETGVVRVPEADSNYNRRFEGDQVTVHDNPRA